MTKLFQFMTAALLGLALIVPAAAQDGQRPKGERKRTGDIVKEPKRGEQRPPANGNDNRGNGDGRNGGGDRGKGKGKGNRPNGYDL